MARRLIPDTSHIIPTRNRPALVGASVASILAGEAVPAELIVVDQSCVPHPSLSSGRTQEGTEIRYLWQPSRGLSRARNTGIHAARHAIISFTDDDVLVAPAWFRSLIEGLIAAGGRTAVTGLALAIEDDRPGVFVPSTSSSEERAADRIVVHEGRARRDVLNGLNMATRASAFGEIGLFDERLGAGARFAGAEDNDFGFRLLESGYRIVLVPAAVVHHRAWRTNRAYLPLRWSYGRGQGAFFAKHLDRHDQRMLRRLERTIRSHLMSIRWQLRREPLKAAGSLVYVLGLLSGVGEWLLTQRQDMSIRRRVAEGNSPLGSSSAPRSQAAPRGSLAGPGRRSEDDRPDVERTGQG